METSDTEQGNLIMWQMFSQLWTLNQGYGGNDSLSSKMYQDFSVLVSVCKNRWESICWTKTQVLIKLTGGRCVMHTPDSAGLNTSWKDQNHIDCWDKCWSMAQLFLPLIVRPDKFWEQLLHHLIRSHFAITAWRNPGAVTGMATTHLTGWKEEWKTLIIVTIISPLRLTSTVWTGTDPKKGQRMITAMSLVTWVKATTAGQKLF